MIMTPDVTYVQALPNYTLVAQFANGEWRYFDMRAYLHYPAFAALQDPSLFKRAYVAYGTVKWTDEIDLSPDTLFLRGKVLEKEEGHDKTKLRD